MDANDNLDVDRIEMDEKETNCKFQISTRNKTGAGSSGQLTFTMGANYEEERERERKKSEREIEKERDEKLRPT